MPNHRSMPCRDPRHGPAPDASASTPLLQDNDECALLLTYTFLSIAFAFHMIRLSLVTALNSFALPLAAQSSFNQAPAGNGCGPVLTAQFNPLGNHKALDLSVSNMFPSDFGVILFGTAPA